MNRVLIPTRIAPPAPLRFGAAAPRLHLHGTTMGTTWSVKLMEPSPSVVAGLHHGIGKMLDRIVLQMSTWIAESDISRFNRARPGTWHSLPHEFFTVLECAVAVARSSGGAYDPTVGKLTSLWGFGPEGARSSPPPEQDVTACRMGGRWSGLLLDPETRRAFQPGVELDLSSVAKGYAVDCVAEYMEARGVRSYLIDIGGELRGLGIKADANPWWVALKQPPEHGAAGLVRRPRRTILALHGLSVATSGDYQRFFEAGGKRYSHTIDPRTGYPVEHDVTSVTVVHPVCMWADALSTAITVLGPVAGQVFAEEQELAALIVHRTASGFEETTTRRFDAMLA